MKIKMIVCSILLIYNLSSAEDTSYGSIDVTNVQVPVTIDGDLERGRKLYLQCRACHSLKENEPHKIGPNLFKIIGSTAGSMKGYNYSDAFSKSEIVWTIENLDLWLERPYEIIPGNKMVFSGMRKQEDRNDLIAYVYDQTTEE